MIIGVSGEDVVSGEGGESGESGEGVEIGRVGAEGSGEDWVAITLRETETITLLSIPGSVILDPGQQQDVQNSNHIYQEACIL